LEATLCAVLLARIVRVLGAFCPKKTRVVPRIADKNHGHQKDKTAYSAGFSLQKEPSKVEHDKHDMIVEEGWVHRFW